MKTSDVVEEPFSAISGFDGQELLAIRVENISRISKTAKVSGSSRSSPQPPDAKDFRKVIVTDTKGQTQTLEWASVQSPYGVLRWAVS